MSADEIAGAFVNHFYTTLDTNPSALAGLYQPQSTMTFEGQKFDGPEAIIGKYAVSFDKLIWILFCFGMLRISVDISISSWKQPQHELLWALQFHIGTDFLQCYSHLISLVLTNPHKCVLNRSPN
jgi:Nuclear transport factor 2 (NTF2) domain